MSSLLDQEYFHAGSSYIREELWENLQLDQFHPDYIKPYGGLWTSRSRMDIGRISDWVDYLEDDEPLLFLNISYLKGCLVKFCDDAKFLEIQDKNDFQNLKDSGFTIKNVAGYPEILDYEKLSEIYDLLYISPFAHPSLRNYCIRTMLALKSSAIEYYRDVSADYPPRHIVKVGDPKPIPPVSSEYLKLKAKIIRQFQEGFSYKSYDDYLLQLNQYKKWFFANFKASNPNIKLPNEVWKHDAVETILENLYHEKYLEKKRTLKEVS